MPDIHVVPEHPLSTSIPLLVRVLGPLEVHQGSVLVDLGAPKQRALFLALLLQRGHVVSVDSLVELLWDGHPPRTAAHSLQIYVSELRRRIVAAGGEPTIVTRRPGYLIEVDAVDVDVDRFDELVRGGRERIHTGASSAVEMLQAALSVWRGEPLTEAGLEELTGQHVDRWRELRLEAMEHLAAALLEDGEYARALSVAESAIRLDAFRERGRELVMHALYRSGRVSDALRSFARFRAVLVDELGIEPSPVLQRLQERILTHDPDLTPGLVPVTPIRGAAGRNPFKGLRPFGEEDAPDFFGRDRLVEVMIERLLAGHHLVAVVGPSGSGKSSAVAAGLLPRLRADAVPGSSHWPIVGLTVGARGVAHLEAALARAFSAGGSSTSPVDAGPSAVEESGRALLLVDQFEDCFLLLDEQEQRALLDRVCAVVSEPALRVTVVLSLRADHYDRALRHRAFGELFEQGVVNVLPMSPEEIERAVVSPARRAGTTVEPALLAELVADTADRPGLLPLLQYALTELFDKSSGGPLRAVDYRAVGGLRGALTRRAEQLRLGWDEEEQEVATQLLLRLARLGDHDRVARNRMPVADLTALEDVDPVAVSAVLEDLARHRLISFDREVPDGRATVEVAHESLYEEWVWLRELVERHRAALRRHASLRLAVDEWESADRDPAYLLGEGRLAELRSWRRDGTLQLTRREVGFLDASEEQAVGHEQDRLARDETQHRLQKKARRRAWLVLASSAALVAAVGIAFLVGDSPPPRVAYAHHDAGFIEGLIENGLDRAAAESPFTYVESLSDIPDAEEDIARLAETGQDLVVVSTNETDLGPVARRFPGTRFVLFQDEAVGSNITSVEFADQETAFLAGAAATLTSTTEVVGFIGGVNTPALLRFEAGFTAGAQAVDASVRVEVAYASRLPSYEGFLRPVLTARAARQLLAANADVLYVPAGAAQFGAFQAVIEASHKTGRHLWAIGADEDAYLVDDWQRTEDSRQHILTSTIKRFDLAAYEAVHDYVRGDLDAGSRVYDVANGGLQLATSGGNLTEHAEQLEALRLGIVEGRLHVPCVPDGITSAEAATAAEGPNCP